MIRENLPLDVPLKTDVDVEACVNQFVHIIQQAAWSSTSTPHRTYQVDECAPRIKQKILDKRKLRKRWQTTRSPQDKAIFNKSTHELKLLLNDLKQQAIQSYPETLTATEATEYSLWKATKRLNRPQTHIPPLRTAAGDWAKSDTQKAHVFQPYDSEIPDVEEREILHPQEAPSRLETPTKKFKITEVRAAIKHMRTKKAPGYDLITGRILKELSEVGLSLIVSCEPLTSRPDGRFPKLSLSSNLVNQPTKLHHADSSACSLSSRNYLRNSS